MADVPIRTLQFNDKGCGKLEVDEREIELGAISYVRVFVWGSWEVLYARLFILQI